MYIDEKPVTVPVRRRIIQQPLRTEAPVALILSNAGPSGELEARLKRAHPLITFPSFSHFLAEPPRREPWAAIVVARAGAWDPQLDRYVRRRSCIALFGLAEESYGWPETVARLRDLAEFDAWFEALGAKEPARKVELRGSARAQNKERASRAPARATKSAVTISLSKSPRSSEAPKAAAPASGDVSPSPEVAASEPMLVTPKSPIQLELAQVVVPPDTRKIPQVRPRKSNVIAVNSSLARPRARFDTARPAQRPKPEARTAARPQRLVEARSSAREQNRDRARDAAAEAAFMRLAAELGLLRASQVLEELRERAANLAEMSSRT